MSHTLGSNNLLGACWSPTLSSAHSVLTIEYLYSLVEVVVNLFAVHPETAYFVVAPKILSNIDAGLYTGIQSSKAEEIYSLTSFMHIRQVGVSQ